MSTTPRVWSDRDRRTLHDILSDVARRVLQTYVRYMRFTREPNWTPLAGNRRITFTDGMATILDSQTSMTPSLFSATYFSIGAGHCATRDDSTDDRGNVQGGVFNLDGIGVGFRSQGGRHLRYSANR